ncbi:uncharacterized protein DUF4349 [Chitinophaga dinghuensis]|uniref:Uncharacterized protein DUF4349 n=1 Tax=Chitinophaga dinghuensis TaxID=1539050 RepID=A0A327VUH9_9BACT|nr:DUF4349 domain-containing protein [Chitinophaga dinghuensis]RAJ79142.1 uncharacterized protein DUF4349 [Chitinophaga dinghuensis]
MRKSIPLWVLPALSLAACNVATERNQSPNAEMMANASTGKLTEAADSVNFESDIESLNAASRKRVRTADVRCRVKNVFDATTALERVTKDLQGIVAESHQENTVSQDKYVPYSADSLMHVRMYSTVAQLTLRVPVNQMDSVVRVLSGMATYIDHRTLKDEDKTMQYLSNSLRNEIATQTPVPNKKHTSLDIAKYKDEKAEKVIDRQLNNLSLMDDVNNATITIAMVQPDRADVVVEVDPAAATRAGFGTELKNALYDGAVILRNILLFLITIWPFLLVGAMAWFLVKKFRKATPAA